MLLLFLFRETNTNYEKNIRNKLIIVMNPYIRIQNINHF